MDKIESKRLTKRNNMNATRYLLCTVSQEVWSVVFTLITMNYNVTKLVWIDVILCTCIYRESLSLTIKQHVFCKCAFDSTLKMYTVQCPESVVGLYSVLCYCPVSYLRQFYVGTVIRQRQNRSQIQSHILHSQIHGSKQAALRSH